MEDSGNNWDLQAVVRGYRVMAKDPFSSFPPLLSSIHKEEEAEVGGDGWCFPNLMMESKSGLEELEELYKPFFSKTQQPSSSSTTMAAAPKVRLVQQPQQQNRQPNPQVPRSKRRKNQQKKVVCHVPADGVSSDMWAWRKYGQKPIKGSPYPRGYYRCSSSKGCLARKQVERSRADPAMFIITYTAEHNHAVPTHRNSLAGSTRNKSPTTQTITTAATDNASGGGDEENPPPKKAGFSPTTPLAASWRQKGEEGEEEDEADEEEEEEGMLLVEDMEVMGEDELLFMGSGEKANGVSTTTQVALSGFFDYEGGLEEPFFNPPWMANSNNTAAAAGGS
ncbi:WRKY transcription factor 22-like [Typha latifolia]|uniref:WRKY transcription factor 22-like n=1 Tax=Typha latifolia TaxID=4733 RepID=UPI003C2EA990